MTIQLMTAQANVPIEFLQFSGGERHIQLQPELLNQLTVDTQIKASLQNSADVMDYLLLENVLLEQGTRLSVEIPYFPYARQDRICAQGQAFSLDLMTKLLNSNSEKFAGQRQKIVVWDCHSQ
jgi:ribose-phosphate pyrophosphokinase